MTQNNSIKPLQIIHANCCGIDIHKDTAVACLNYVNEETGEIQEVVRTFTCFTEGLYELKSWLLEKGCKILAIESTGVYWKPVHNVLEHEMEILLVNARHFKNVPGRKTDVNDSQWLCTLLKHGLLKGSFIPPAHVREWRELTRLRRNLVKDLSNYKRQIHKIFQTANIKIDSVVSDLFGVTGRNLMDLLCNEQDITHEAIVTAARGSLRDKTEELAKSLKGFFTEHHRFQIKSLRQLIFELEKTIERISDRIQSLMGEHTDILTRLRAIPGVELRSAQVVLSELGNDLKSFETPEALSSWAGVSPGNNQSGGKSRSGRSPVRKHVFKEALIQMAWAAIKTKGSFWKDKYYKLKARRGAQRAIVAIAHKMLKVIYMIIKQNATYQEVSLEVRQAQKEKQVKRLEKQAKLLGYELSLI